MDEFTRMTGTTGRQSSSVNATCKHGTPFRHSGLCLLHYMPWARRLYNRSMEPVPRKLFVECPRCRSPAVHVPWEPKFVQRRKRIFRGLVLLWITSIAWVVLGLVQGGLLWVVGLASYALVTVVASVVSYRSARGYHCSACNLRWHL